MTTRTSDTTDDEVRRFEAAVHELIDEGYSVLDVQGLLRAAAERAGIELERVHPTMLWDAPTIH
jgi:hypothetical protein